VVLLESEFPDRHGAEVGDDDWGLVEGDGGFGELWRGGIEGDPRETERAYA